MSTKRIRNRGPRRKPKREPMRIKRAWTPDEYRRFKVLVDKTSSRVQMERIVARLDMPKFIEEVGKEKCDAMFAFMTRNDKPQE